MRVYLVRHGEARSEDIDPERHLTDAGAETVKRIAADVCGDLDIRPGRIVHSGKARARQTAEIWAGLVGTTTLEADGLAPNDDPAIWARRLGTESDDLMLVGHLPHLERLAALLVTGRDEQPVAGFPAGGLVALEHGEDGWTVTAVRP